MYRAHHQAIWRTVRRLGHSPEQAADATHQAYLIAAERLDSIFLGSERAYLFSTAIRVAQGLARKSRRDELRADPEDGDDVRGPQRHDSLSQRHAATAFIEQLFARMDPPLVTVFVLYELEGFSAPEIASILSIPVGTVASRLRRAREEFRAIAAKLENHAPRPSSPPPSSPAPLRKEGSK